MANQYLCQSFNYYFNKDDLSAATHYLISVILNLPNDCF
jgi:transposase-like protein